jgi:DNA (cytosine-5)-methyltransferase 1
LTHDTEFIVMYKYMTVFLGSDMRAVEIFCGAGGMSRGLVDAGFEVVKAYDAWPVAVETYRHNVGREVEIADLANLLPVVPEICKLAPDVICGGPPCQDYSVAGRRREAENAGLTTAFAVIVTTARPQWFIMENVIPASRSEVWAEARNMLKRAGYGLSESKINAAYYGVPQARRRLFIVGRLGERDGFLQSALAGAASAEPMTMRDLFDPAISKSPALQPHGVCSGSEQSRGNSSSSRKPAQRQLMAHPEDLELIRNGYFYCRPLREGRGVRRIDEPAATISRTSWERLTSRYMNSPHPKDPVPASEAVELSRRQISRIQGFPEA